MRRWLRRLHDEINVTSVLVTHDQEEALEVADRVVVMNAGRIEQVGKPEEVYERPATPFVYNFLGKVNFFHGRIINGKAYIGETAIDLAEDSYPDTDHAVLYVRPHLLEIERQPNDKSHFSAKVKRINKAGPLVKVELLTEWGDSFHAEISRERFRDLQLETDVDVFIRPKEMKLFNGGSD